MMLFPAHSSILYFIAGEKPPTKIAIYMKCIAFPGDRLRISLLDGHTSCINGLYLRGGDESPLFG
jgi:hypothetical protein